MKVGKALFDYASVNDDETSWDDICDELSAYIQARNPSGLWHAEVENFGWQKLSGTKDFEARNGRLFLNAILPQTDCTFKVYQYGRKGLAINNFHHDSPTGDEWYYVTAARKRGGT